MKILVTGHRGFIGQNMFKSLQADGHTVFGWEFNDYPLTPDDWADLGLVIHLGAITSTTSLDTEAILTQNYYYSKWIISMCKERHIPIHFASTAAVYGTDNTTFNIRDKPAPKNFYAWSKLMVEEYIRCTTNHFDSVHIFRYFNVYGPHEDHKGEQASPFHKFRKQALETGEIKIFEGSENFKRDFIHVDEIIKLHKYFMIERPDQARPYNFGTGKARSFRDVAEEIAQETGAKIIEIPMPESLKASYQKYTCADLSDNYIRLHEAK